MGGAWAAVVMKVPREGHKEKMLFEQRPERDEGGAHVNGKRGQTHCTQSTPRREHAAHVREGARRPSMVAGVESPRVERSGWEGAKRKSPEE